MSEDSVLLDSPLDKIEPYQLFRATLMSKFSRHLGPVCEGSNSSC